MTTIITICSSRLPDDNELLSRCVRTYLRSVLHGTIVVKLDHTHPAPDFMVEVALRGDCTHLRATVEQNLKRALGINREVDVVFI